MDFLGADFLTLLLNLQAIFQWHLVFTLCFTLPPKQIRRATWVILKAACVGISTCSFTYTRIPSESGYQGFHPPCTGDCNG